jgi:hypothetical protein
MRFFFQLKVNLQMTENERFVGGGFLVLNGGILRFW